MKIQSSKALSWFFILLFLMGYNCEAQNGAENNDNFAKMVDFLPPPPNAAAIAKYVGIAVNKNTGAPNIGISLLSLKGKSSSVDISLNYASAGIKVDEIASRTGMGWVLNAGGVITRTVRGWADETHPRIMPWAPIDVNWQTFAFMKKVSDAKFVDGYDSEPDLFTFNCPGASGSFVFDGNMNLVQFPYSNVKILHDFNGTNWKFKIITADGVIYEFGGPGATERTKRTSDCARNYNDYIPTAWYLSKIIYPAGDVFTFGYTSNNYNYETGVSQTMMYIPPVAPNSADFYICNPTALCSNSIMAVDYPTCVNFSLTQGALLTDISSNNNQRISLHYISRNDCSDKLIDDIRLIRSTDNAVIEKYTLNYNFVTSSNAFQSVYAPGTDNTPYLTSLTESSGDNSISKVHSFVYNDPSARPKRLSFSQDHWGYFNGKNNQNLIPKPYNGVDAWIASRFPNALADRDAVDIYASKGMLNKIMYPTGGIDSIIYESNSYTAPAAALLTHEFTCEVVGPAFNTLATNTFGFSVTTQQSVELNISVNTTPANGSYDVNHDWGRVTISNGSGTQFEETLAPGFSPDRSVNLLPGSYTLTLQANGNAIRTAVDMKYKPGEQSLGNTNTVTGGLRVKAILTGSNGLTPMVKRYYYGNLADLNTSSALPLPPPDYVVNGKKRTTCFINLPNGGPARNYCNFIAMYSNSITGLFDYQSAPVSYASVVESEGENFEGGGTQTRFVTVADESGIPLWGNGVYHAPRTAHSNYANGKILEETILKKGTNGNLFPLKKKIYSYNFDSRGFKSVWGYSVNKKYAFGPALPADSTCIVDPALNPGSWVTCLYNLQSNIECFDMTKYEFPSQWIYNDTTREIVYDENGQNPVTNTSVNYYDNAQYLLPTRSETWNSKGEKLTTAYKYPFDFTSNTVFSNMVASNIFAPVVDVKTTNNSTPLTEVKTNYTQLPVTGYFAINSIEKADQGGPFITEGTIPVYDSYKNICEFTGKDGVINAILWGYNYQYPVAKIAGATYAQALAQLTGASIQGLDGQPLRDELNRIRTGIPAAQVTSYTYKPMVGVSTITDPNNKTNSFEYDGLNRLVLVKDQEGYAVKKMEYAYNVNASTGQFGVYTNTAQSQSFQCQHCAPGFGGSQVLYNVPAGRFYSVISQADADAKALADLQANGQTYANIHGSCSNDICYEEGYKTINCICVKGTKVCDNAVQNADGTWTNTYHYHWADGTNSPSYTNTTPACTGEGYKRVGCDCEPGFKVNTSSYFQLRPVRGWVCVYHYHFSDNTKSIEYTTTGGAEACAVNGD